MKTVKTLIIATIFCLVSLPVVATSVEKMELVNVLQGENHDGKPFKAFFFGIKSEKEPQIRRHDNCSIPTGCVPDEYIIKEVDMSFVAPNGSLVDPWRGIDMGNGSFFYFGESYSLFYNASYDKEGVWKGWVIKKIFVDFYNNDLDIDKLASTPIIEPTVIFQGETVIQNWGPTDITIYGVPCPEEMKEFKNKNGMDQWVIDNVVVHKNPPASKLGDVALFAMDSGLNDKGLDMVENILDTEYVVYFGEIMGIVINAHYGDNNKWNGVQVTSFTMTQKKS